eukprot:CAMPEP_0184529524 /NCGR_PEP_ID=MMETSP0198_2-20121128/12427_1 /TAXON_ID=1112570 /ORGANISM="Thraustochytrium sp., Strain LLF1b" /LENGTH=255 /DNA_ID=CAMNT_0026921555 /DNA_START=215 /DNA_END=979 /DNA_ORIENTATION=+
MSGQALNAPLMGNKSDDPFYAFRDEIHQHVQDATERFHRWKNLLSSTDTSSNLEFKREHAALGKELTKLKSNVSDLDQVLQRVQTHRSNFSHISDDELASRQAFIREMKNEIQSMSSAMNSPQTLGKMDLDRKQNLLKRSTDASSSNQGPMGNAAFIEDQQQQQQQILGQQDEHLDELGHGATRLGHMALAIGEEIDQQNHMLDELQDDLDATSGRMEAVLGRMDKMLKTNSRCQTKTILVLMAILFFLILLVAW